MVPQDCLYTEQHEWLRVEGETAVMGLTAYAAAQLGDVTFIELPQVGQALIQGDPLGEVESVKAASEVFAPASGTVTEVNEELEDTPELVNSDPHGAGWICKFTLIEKAELDALLTPESYEAILD
jgi:glycine cleavage system H protein